MEAGSISLTEYKHLYDEAKRQELRRKAELAIMQNNMTFAEIAKMYGIPPDTPVASVLEPPKPAKPLAPEWLRKAFNE